MRSAEDFVKQAHIETETMETSYGPCVMVVNCLKGHGFDATHVVNAAILYMFNPTALTPTDIRTHYGTLVADIVFAVSDQWDKPKQREENTYRKIRAIGADALAIKLADRIIRVSECLRTGDRRLKQYKREHSAFLRLKDISRDTRIMQMWILLEKLIS